MIYKQRTVLRARLSPFAALCQHSARAHNMLAPILAWPAVHRAACRMQADDLNRAFASYASEARRGGLLWEGPEPDAAFAPDEVCTCGE